MVIDKKELQEKILNSLTNKWIATTKLSKLINHHPDQIKLNLIELFNNGDNSYGIEQKLKNKFIYWRKNDNSKESEESS